MKLLDRLAGAFTPNATAQGQVPAVQALGEGGTFTSLDDPALHQFLLQGHIGGQWRTKADALTNATLFRAMSLICSSLGMLPFHLFQKLTDEAGKGYAAKADAHPHFRLIYRKPNDYQTPMEFKSQMQASLLLEGCAYAYAPRNARGIVERMVPLQAARVRPFLSDDFKMFFRYNRPQGGERVIPAMDMLHMRSPLTMEGPNGMPVGVALLRVAAEALGLASQAEKAQASIFRNGSIVGGVLQHPKTLTSPAIERLRQQFEDRHAGSENAGKWIVAEEGLEAKSISTSGKDAQAVEARKLQVEEIGRFTGVPRPLLMVDETSWGSGIEQLGLFFVTYCLMPWFIVWEEALNRTLLTEREQETMYFKVNEGALLRGSLKDQAEFFTKALGSGGAPGWLSQDEVRELSERAPIPGGDVVSRGSGAAAAAPGPGEGAENEPEPGQN